MTCEHMDVKTIFKCANNCSKPLFKTPDAYVMKLMAEVKLKCQNEDCKELMGYKDYADHLKKCQHQPMQCPNKCEMRLLGKDTATHVCPLAKNLCETCNLHMKEPHDCFEALMAELKVEQAKEAELKKSLGLDLTHKCEKCHLIMERFRSFDDDQYEKGNYKCLKCPFRADKMYELDYYYRCKKCAMKICKKCM